MCVSIYSASSVSLCIPEREEQTTLFALGLSGAGDTGGAEEGRNRCELELRQPGRGKRYGASPKVAVRPSHPAYSPFSAFFFLNNKKNTPPFGKMKEKERNGERYCNRERESEKGEKGQEFTKVLGERAAQASPNTSSPPC